jgi:hypothetical protein
MNFDFMNAILLHNDHRHVAATHLAVFRVVKCQNTNIFRVSRDHSTVKKNILLVKILLDGKTVMNIRY